MRCVACGHENDPHSTACARCGSPRVGDIARAVEEGDGTVVIDSTLPPRARAAPPTRPGTTDTSSEPAAPTAHGQTGPLQVGHPFGPRYHIIRLLGMGGMGAVYQAWDDELGVAVAIKVIRPQTAADPEVSEQTERRFKRELLLARQVTHKNVVRIHDLGDIDGIKYITMPYIQGSSLEAILKSEGKLTPSRTLHVGLQIARGLAAAHDVGIVHRDLKPANVMIDTDGCAIIMDFGISQSAGSPSATTSMAVVGTIAYMAPEQAMGGVVDHRADIYAFGLILYDVLSGGRQAAAGSSALAELMGRMREPPEDISVLRPDVPPGLAALVSRCLLPAPEQRFQTTGELVAELEALQAGSGHTGTVGPRATIAHTAVGAQHAAASKRTASWAAMAAAAALVVAVSAGAWYWRSGRVPAVGEATAAQASGVSLAVLPFRNNTGDAALDWLGASLAETIGSDLGHAGGVHVVQPDRLFRILKDLRIPPDTELDASAERRLNDFSKADVLVVGRYARLGSNIRLEATLRGPARQTPVMLAQDAQDERQLPEAVRALVAAIQQNLVGSAKVQQAAAPAAPLSASVGALKAYTEGLTLVRQGRTLDAVPRFTAAVAEDPEFALAYARLAQAQLAVGSSRDANDAARRAAELAEQAPPEQRYRVEALAAQVRRDLPRAISSFERLLQVTPDDEQVLVDVGMLYETTGAFDKAVDAFSRVLARDPNYGEVLYAMGRVEIRRRNPQAALDHLTKGLTLAIQADNQEARGDMLNAIGIAYKRLNKTDDALRYYREALDVRRSLDYKRGVAATLTEIGQIQSDLQRTDEAMASFTEALEIRRATGDTQGVGNTLLELGRLHEKRNDPARALELFRESLQVQIDAGNENYQGLLLHNIGAMHQLLGRYDDATTYFQRALEIRTRSKVAVDIAETLHGLGETELRVGRLEESLSHFMKALELRRSVDDRRGGGRESAGLSTVFAAQGRYKAALDAAGEAVTALRAERDQAGLAEALVVQAAASASLGHGEQAQTLIQEALGMAAQLKQTRLEALAEVVRAQTYMNEGDYMKARASLERATRAAGRAAAPDLDLRLRLDLARVDVDEGRAAAAASLQALEQRADSLGLRPLAAEAAVYAGRAAASARNDSVARSELERAIELADRMGLRAIEADAHASLGALLQRSGNQAGAAREFADARELVEEIRTEARTDALLARADLRRTLAVAAAPAVTVTSR